MHVYCSSYLRQWYITELHSEAAGAPNSTKYQFLNNVALCEDLATFLETVSQ